MSSTLQRISFLVEIVRWGRTDRLSVNWSIQGILSIHSSEQSDATQSEWRSSLSFFLFSFSWWRDLRLDSLLCSLANEQEEEGFGRSTNPSQWSNIEKWIDRRESTSQICQVWHLSCSCRCERNWLNVSSGKISRCPPVEIFVTKELLSSPQCPVYSNCSSRLDRPLFSLIVSEGVQSFTSLVMQNGETKTFVWFIVDRSICLLLDDDVDGEEFIPPSTLLSEERDFSPTSQLSQSSTRVGSTIVKDIRRDEPMLIERNK